MDYNQFINLDLMSFMIRKGFLLVGLWSFSFLCFAAEFSAQTANHLLKEASHYTGNTHVNLKFLQTKVAELNQQMALATDCVKKLESELTALDETIKLAERASGASRSGADLRYLKGQRNKRQETLAQCRLFQFKAEDVLTNYHQLISKIAKSRIWSKDKPIWQAVDFKSADTAKSVLDDFKFYLGGFSDLTLTTSISLILFCLFVYALFSFLVRKLARRFSDKLFEDSVIVINHSLSVSFSVVLASNLFFNLYLDNAGENSSTDKFLFLILSYFSLVILLRFLRHLKLTSSLFKWLEYDLMTVYCFGRFMILIMLISGSLIISSQSGVLNSFEVRMLQSLAILCSYLLLLWFTNLLIRTQSNFSFIKNNRKMVVASLWSLFFVSIVIDITGYHALAFYVCRGLVLSIPGLFLFMFMWHFLDKIYREICGERPFARKLSAKLGVERHDKPLELIILNAVIRFLATLLFVYIFLTFWDISGNTQQLILETYFKGFELLGFEVVPRNIVSALFLFCVLNLLVRFFSNRLAVVERRKDRSGSSQISISPILMYFGFCVSILIALLIAGVNLTGIAIVAGALSVGIGLGLKNIINNFVSGLILLFERPIKAGDRIKVDDYEGIVTKVRVRATEIRSRDRSEIIIPNEEMITRPVVNFMLRESLWRIKCFVGVGYDSDVHLVKKLLLEIAHEHPGVVTDDELNKPNVLFLSFGDSSLDFVLRCIIRDVNRKNFIISDLNFEIHQRFKEYGIEIPYPQRDLHFKGKDEH